MSIYGRTSEFTFGKYKGRTVDDVLSEDYRYILWCVDNIDWLDFDADIVEEAEQLKFEDEDGTDILDSPDFY